MLDYKVIMDYFLSQNRLGLMVVYRNENRYDSSDVLIENGFVTAYDKERPSAEMVYINEGLSVLRKQSLAEIPHEHPLSLQELFQGLRVVNPYFQQMGPAADNGVAFQDGRMVHGFGNQRIILGGVLADDKDKSRQIETGHFVVQNGGVTLDESLVGQLANALTDCRNGELQGLGYFTGGCPAVLLQYFQDLSVTFINHAYSGMISCCWNRLKYIKLN